MLLAYILQITLYASIFFNMRFLKCLKSSCSIKSLLIDNEWFTASIAFIRLLLLSPLGQTSLKDKVTKAH